MRLHGEKKEKMMIDKVEDSLCDTCGLQTPFLNEYYLETRDPNSYMMGLYRP